MTKLQLLHTIFFIVYGIMLLCEIKGAKKSSKYRKLIFGILSLLIALYDILVLGFGLTIF
jgi:hypothetical protein